MTKLIDRKMIISTLICLSPIIAGVILYDRLPAEMATHFNFHNQPDGFSSKNFTVFGIPSLMALLNLFVHFMLNNDPKKANFAKTMTTLTKWSVPIITAFVMAMTFAFNLGYPFNIGRVTIIAVSGLIIMMGNYLPKCKQNYSMGIRVSWTLNDPEIWDKTHRLGGYLWTAGGIVMLTVALLNLYPFLLFWAVFAIIVFVPFVYAYMLYRRKVLSNNSNNNVL